MYEDNRPWKINPPEDLAEYILMYGQKQAYMIFSTKKNICTCTRCGMEMPLDRFGYLGHCSGRQITTVCPECHDRVIPKDARYGRKRLTDFGRITWSAAAGQVTYLETDEYIIDYQTVHPEVRVQPISQIRLCKGEQRRMDRYYYYGSWYPVKKIDFRGRSQCAGWSKWHDHLYVPTEWPGLGPDAENRIRAGTDLEYADIRALRFLENRFDEHHEIKAMIRYMSDFLKYPAIEILEKSGFEGLVMERAAGKKSRQLNLRATDLRKILKLNRAEIRELREIGPKMEDLEDLREIRRLAPWAKVSDIRELRQILPKYMREEHMDLIRKHADLSKVLRVLLAECRQTGDHLALNDYADYLQAVIDLGRRLDKRTIYPKNFRQAHDEANDLAEKQKDVIQYEKFAKYEREITRMIGPFISGEFLIRPAENPAELRKESAVLNHCVKSYISRIIDGKTSILFIRRTEEPDKPYFTLELSPQGKIIQCRGYRNCSYPDEVRAFIEEWKAWWDKQIRDQKTGRRADKPAAYPAA